MKAYIHLINGCQEVCFKDKKSGCTIGIMAGYGAGLNRYEIPFKKGTFNLIKGYNEKADFEKLYNSVILVPFPNRIKNGQYTFEGKTYQLPINQTNEQNAIHGLLFDKAFTIESMQTKNSQAYLTLSYLYKGDVEGYPFPFKCKVRYIWNPEQFLNISVSIENTGQTALPAGIGWHPYFTFPVLVNELALQLNCIHQYKVDERMIPTMQTQTFDAFQEMNLISKTQLDDCFALAQNKTIETTLKDEHNGIELSIIQETGKHQYKYIQIYTPKDRKSIALEPMTCMPDVFNNGEGIWKLQPDEKIEVAFKLKIKHLENNI